MAMTPIKDRAEFDELCSHLAKQGLHIPHDVQTVEEFGRHLLTGLKTRAAVLAQREAKRAAKQAARDGNPDSPRDDDDDDQEAMNKAMAVGQFSTAGDGTPRPMDAAARASAVVSASERFHRNPNFARDPFAT